MLLPSRIDSPFSCLIILDSFCIGICAAKNLKAASFGKKSDIGNDTRNIKCGRSKTFNTDRF